MSGSGIAAGEDFRVDAMTNPRSARVDPVRTDDPAARSKDENERLEDLASNLDFLWRFACRMGAAPNVAEDIAQDAFVIAASRIDDIIPGKERSFLVSIVVRRARRERTYASRHEELTVELAASIVHPDDLLDDDRARRLLDMALASLDEDLRAIFILHEIEEETMADIAHMLDLAPGTVASRLRRARGEWQKATARLKRDFEPRRSP